MDGPRRTPLWARLGADAATLSEMIVLSDYVKTNFNEHYRNLVAITISDLINVAKTTQEIKKFTFERDECDDNGPLLIHHNTWIKNIIFFYGGVMPLHVTKDTLLEYATTVKDKLDEVAPRITQMMESVYPINGCFNHAYTKMFNSYMPITENVTYHDFADIRASLLDKVNRLPGLPATNTSAIDTIRDIITYYGNVERIRENKATLTMTIILNTMTEEVLHIVDLLITRIRTHKNITNAEQVQSFIEKALIKFLTK